MKDRFGEEHEYGAEVGDMVARLRAGEQVLASNRSEFRLLNRAEKTIRRKNGNVEPYVNYVWEVRISRIRCRDT